MDYIDRMSQYLTQEDMDGSIYGGNRKRETVDLTPYTRLDTDTLVEVAVQARERGDDSLHTALVTMIARRPDRPQRRY